MRSPRRPRCAQHARGRVRRLGRPRRVALPGVTWQHLVPSEAQRFQPRSKSPVQEMERPDHRARTGRPRRTDRGISARTPEIRRLWLEHDAPEGFAAFILLEAHRRKMRTKNGIGRPIQQQLKRQTRKIRFFPDVDSPMHLVSELLVGRDEKWFTGNAYVTWGRNDD